MPCRFFGFGSLENSVHRPQGAPAQPEPAVADRRSRRRRLALRAKKHTVVALKRVCVVQ